MKKLTPIQKAEFKRHVKEYLGHGFGFLLTFAPNAISGKYSRLYDYCKNNLDKIVYQKSFGKTKRKNAFKDDIRIDFVFEYCKKGLIYALGQIEIETK